MSNRTPHLARVAPDGTAEAERAAGAGHHLALGPGKALTDEWTSAGLTLPDLDLMRGYRLGRIQQTLRAFDYGGIILFDPLNIRYATDATNMQVWVMHNGARYTFVSADGYVVLWEFTGCEFLSGHNELICEVRPAIASNYFLAGNRYKEKARAWALEMVAVIEQHCGAGARIAMDQCHRLGYLALADAGVTVGDGTEVMEEARKTKGPDEVRAMRCAAHACQATMYEMRDALRPGMTERAVWAMLHEGNIRRAGEWIETQICASGPRTNPWFQEVSSRVIEDGDVVAFDTDLVGAYGMMIDISRTWIAGDRRPSADQQRMFEMAADMVATNAELLTPGRTFRELTFDSVMPDPADYRHYSVVYHGVGMCDEYPGVYPRSAWDESGYDGLIETGMVLTSESYVGSRQGGEGVKLENQYLVTNSGPELLTDFPVSLR